MNFNFISIISLFVISYFLLNKGLYEIRKFVKYIRNANTNYKYIFNLDFDILFGG